MSTLERAIAIAVKGHAGQVDKAGAPYILHPLRVMLSFTERDCQIVGVLHDVVEDCDGWSFERLRRAGFSPQVVDAVEAVTKRQDEEGPDNYMAFIERAAKNPIGRRVKLADLRDNMDITRIEVPVAKDFERLERYHKAAQYLEQLS